jgi:hypothetical protein
MAKFGQTLGFKRNGYSSAENWRQSLKIVTITLTPDNRVYSDIYRSLGLCLLHLDKWAMSDDVFSNSIEAFVVSLDYSGSQQQTHVENVQVSRGQFFNRFSCLQEKFTPC